MPSRQQTINGTLAAATNIVAPLLPYNIFDDPGTYNQSVRSPGATAITRITSQPYVTRKWLILGWSISFYGIIFVESPGLGGARAFGRLGKLIGGLLASGSVAATNGPSGPWVQPIQPFPADVSTLAVLWDGETDAPFQQISPPTFSAFTPSPISYSAVLPQAIEYDTNDQIGIGLWLTPSLAQNVQTVIMGGRFSISYTSQ